MNAYKRAADEAYAAWARTHRQVVRMQRQARERGLSELDVRELARLEALESIQFRHASRQWRLYQLQQCAHAVSAGISRNLRRTLRVQSPAVPWLARKEVEMKTFKHWESIVTTLLGVWLMVSPWLLKFAETTVARDDAVLTGLAALVVGLWALARENDWQVPSRERATS